MWCMRFVCDEKKNVALLFFSINYVGFLAHNQEIPNE